MNEHLLLITKERLPNCHVEYDATAFNVRYIMPNFSPSGEVRLEHLPNDIQLRVELSRLALSQMPTTIVFPGVVLTPSVLRDSVCFSNDIMSRIGLPASPDAYIRTRPTPNIGFMGRKTINRGYSRRSLIVLNAGNILREKCIEFDDSLARMTTYQTAISWQNTLEQRMMYMIHSENGSLQRRCLHGVVAKVNDELEVFIGDKRLHARGLSERPSGKPFVRMRGTDVMSVRRDTKIQTSTSSDDDASRLVQWWFGVRDQVEAAYTVVKAKWGSNLAMEWRAYPGSSVNSLQLLDVDRGI